MKPSRQQALLVITPIKPDHREALEALFDEIVDCDVEDNEWVPFASLTTVHFARWAILPASVDVDGRHIPDQLCFSSNYDAPLQGHLEELVNVAGESGLDVIYNHCDGYPDHPTKENRIAYLKRHRQEYTAFYVGTVGRTVLQIRQEAALRDALQAFLNSRDWSGSSAAEIRSAAQAFAFDDNQPAFAWAKNPPAGWYTPWVRVLKHGLKAIVIALIVLLLGLLVFGVLPWGVFLGSVGLLVVLFALFVLTLRYKENRDEADPVEYSCPEVRSDLVEREDLVVQNQMTSILNIKPGWFRLTTLRIVQGAINFAARFIANEGNLGGIPSIHFARWAIVDEGRRLLFLSNFDGSWENYLGDFIDKAASGLTAVWSNTVGFPKTQWLFLRGGARDEQRFKAFARKSQVTTNVWYTAYKTLSVQNINDNSKIRAGLLGDMTDAESRAWLRRF